MDNGDQGKQGTTRWTKGRRRQVATGCTAWSRERQALMEKAEQGRSGALTAQGGPGEGRWLWTGQWRAGEDRWPGAGQVLTGEGRWPHRDKGEQGYARDHRLNSGEQGKARRQEVDIWEQGKAGVHSQKNESKRTRHDGQLVRREGRQPSAGQV